MIRNAVKSTLVVCLSFVLVACGDDVKVVDKCINFSDKFLSFDEENLNLDWFSENESCISEKKKRTITERLSLRVKSIPRKNIIDKFKTSIPQNKFSLHYKVLNKFESSGHHVFISEVTARTSDENNINYSCGNVVSIIKIDNEKVMMLHVSSSKGVQEIDIISSNYWYSRLLSTKRLM